MFTVYAGCPQDPRTGNGVHDGHKPDIEVQTGRNAWFRPRTAVQVQAVQATDEISKIQQAEKIEPPSR